MNLEAQGLLICKFKSRRQGLNPDLWYYKVHVPSSGESHHRLPMAGSVWFWVWLLSSSLLVLQGPAWWPSSPSDNQHSLLDEHYAVYRARFWARAVSSAGGFPGREVDALSHDFPQKEPKMVAPLMGHQSWHSWVWLIRSREGGNKGRNKII